MQNPTFHSGGGDLLRQLQTNTTFSEPPLVNGKAELGVTGVTDIVNGEICADHRDNGDALEVQLKFELAAVGAGTVKIYVGPSPVDYSKALLVDTVDLTGSYYGNWSSGQPIGGIIYVENSTGVTIKVRLQKRIN